MAGILHEMCDPVQSAYYAHVRKIKGVIAGISMLALTVGFAPAGQPDAFIRITPDEVPFKSATDAEPVQAVLYGDPAKPGIYVLRVRFPPGTHSNPHFHSQDRHVTVVKGVWWMGVGEKLDFKKTVPLKAGSYAFHPAGAVHWDGAADEEAIVQITGMGPVETVQVGAAGEPPGYWPAPKGSH